MAGQAPAGTRTKPVSGRFWATPRASAASGGGRQLERQPELSGKLRCGVL
jgi:hypothetical protein